MKILRSDRADLKTEWCQSRLSVGRFCPEEGGLSQCIAVNINSWWIISDYSEWIDYADNRGGMKTKNPDHHPGNARIRGRRFLTFHAANVQIWATGHFLSRLVKHNRNNNNQLGFYKERLDMLVWLNNWTNIFLNSAHCQTTIGFFQNRCFSPLLRLAAYRSWTRSQAIFDSKSGLDVDRWSVGCEE